MFIVIVKNKETKQVVKTATKRTLRVSKEKWMTKSREFFTLFMSLEVRNNHSKWEVRHYEEKCDQKLVNFIIRNIYRLRSNHNSTKMDNSVPTSSSVNEFSGIASEVS